MRKIVRIFTLGLSALLPFLCAVAEIQVVNGVRYECKDGLCMIVGEEGTAAVQPPATNLPPSAFNLRPCRLAQGYMSGRDFVRWLEGNDEPDDVRLASSVRSAGFWLGLLAILLGGLAMNLTPCVLPMIPINLLVIGKSVARGAWYGLGMALAYGTLGVAAAAGGLAFGTIQANPWFNLAVAAVFAILALALLGVFFIDFSRFRPSGTSALRRRHPSSSVVFPFFMGVMSAVLAGACVAPILISVLLLTGKLYAEGHGLALGLPFVLGLGMALPWPFVGAGLKVLPKPGPWMKTVNRLFAIVVLGFAVWYGRLAVLGFLPRTAPAERAGAALAATPETLGARLSALGAQPTARSKPILIDCWASWCKNCTAMERVMEEPAVKRALAGFTVVRLQAEDMGKLRSLKGFESIRGLPAFAIVRQPAN